MKNELEIKAGLKIRRGFDKFIESTLLFFNFVNIGKDEAIQIINFINKSNSALSESYWILRKGLTLDEANEQRKTYCDEWVKSSYKHTNRKSVSRKFVGVNKSRGYSGWCEINDKKFYCRSQFEFVCVHYLHKIYLDHIIEYEHSIFHLNQKRSYKPDYFVFKNNILVKVVEVKSSIKFKQTDEFKELTLFFLKNKIDFELFTEMAWVLKEYSDIKDKLVEWKNNNASIAKDMKGINNPRYGIKLSESGRKIVSEKATKRAESESYRKQISDNVKLTIVNKFVKETNCLFPIKEISDEKGIVFYYIEDDDKNIIYPRAYYRIKNIKNLINENK